MRYATVEDLKGMGLPALSLEERAAVARAVTQLAADAQDAIARRYGHRAGLALAQGVGEGICGGVCLGLPVVAAGSGAEG